MAELTFGGMTWPILREKYGIRLVRATALLGERPTAKPSATLEENLRRARHSRLPNERARAYRFIDPVLAEVEEQRRGQIATLPETAIEVTGWKACAAFRTSSSPAEPAMMRRYPS